MRHLLKRIWTTFPPLRGLKALICSTGNCKSQLCSYVCLEKSAPNPKRVKDLRKKTKNQKTNPQTKKMPWSDHKSSHSRSSESGLIFQKSLCPEDNFRATGAEHFWKPAPFTKVLTVFEGVQMFPLVYGTAWKQWVSPVSRDELPMEPPATKPTPEAQICCSVLARSAWPHTLVMPAVCNSL